MRALGSGGFDVDFACVNEGNAAMTTSYGALCNDFYINQKLNLKMPLPTDRETVLHFFDRVKRSEPSMNVFRKFEGEFALESKHKDAQYKWLSMQGHTLRSGHVNPAKMTDGYTLHQLILEMAPYHLSISALDVDSLELMFGFDLECEGDQDEVIARALYDQSPLEQLSQVPGSRIMDVQPTVGMKLSKRGDLQAFFEVKTRRRGRRGSSKRYQGDPISLFLTVRQFGPIAEVEDLSDIFKMLEHHAQTLATEKLIPHLLTPITRQITSTNI